MEGFSLYFGSGFSLLFFICSVVESRKFWMTWNRSYFWIFLMKIFTISEALLQFQMNIGFEILYKTAGVVLLLNSIWDFYSYIYSFSWSNKRHIKPYLVKILLHKIECSAYALLDFLSTFLTDSGHSTSCSGEEEPGALACGREMWCGDGTVTDEEDKETSWDWIWLVGWIGVFWWEIPSPSTHPVDGRSQSYVHMDCVPREGKTLP